MRRPLRGLVLVIALAGLAAAQSADPPPALRRLDDADAAVRAAAVKELEAAADRDQLVADWLRDADLRGRMGAPALTTLAQLTAAHDLRAANPGLRAIVRDEKAPLDARRAAATALGKTGGIADVGALADALPAMPEETSKALAAIGGAAAENALRRGGGENPPRETLAALAKLGDAAAFEALVARLEDAATAPRTAQLLAWATDRELGAEPAAWRAFARRETMTRALVDPDNEAAQKAAVKLADEIRASGGAGPANDLADLLLDTKAPSAARAKAALALGLSGTDAHDGALLTAAANEQPGEVRRYAVDALARVGDLATTVDLAKMLVHDEDRDRLLAKRSPRNEFVSVDPAMVRCLFRKGCPGGVLMLFENMEGDFRTGLQRDAMRAFAEVSGGQTFGYEPDGKKQDCVESVARMRAWWRDGRDQVGEWLRPDPDDGGWPSFRQQAGDLVKKGLAEKKFLYQFRAKRSLAILAEPASEQLIAALDDDTLHIRMGASEVMDLAALRRFAVPLVTRLGKETNSTARVKYLTALESCARPLPGGLPPGGEATREALRGALGAKSLDERIAAVRALGVAGDRAEDPARMLAALAKEQDEIFRGAAAMALLRLGDRSGMKDLIAELRCDDVARRAEVFRVMRANGVLVPDYNPDGPPEEREKAIQAFEESVPKNVPPEERK